MEELKLTGVLVKPIVNFMGVLKGGYKDKLKVKSRGKQC